VEIRREFFFGPRDGHYVICPFQTANEKSNGGCVSRPNGDSLPSLPVAPFTGVAGRSGLGIPGSARGKHDRQLQAAGSPSGEENPEVQCLSLFNRPDNTYEQQSGGPSMEKEVMELRVQLKVCEACGCLWFRSQVQGSVYCRSCDEKLKDFPSPESRKRRGRPSRKSTARLFASVGSYSAIGGVQ